MWKFVSIGSVALGIASTSFLYAEQSRFLHTEQLSSPDEGQLWQPGPQDLHAFGEAELAALRSQLSLTPQQAKNWPAFEQAALDFQKLRMDRRTAAADTLPGKDLVERLQRRARTMLEAATALKNLANAAEPLYSSLDENQKNQFAILPLDRTHFHGRNDGVVRR